MRTGPCDTTPASGDLPRGGVDAGDLDAPEGWQALGAPQSAAYSLALAKRRSGRVSIVDFLVVHGAWSAGWAWRKMRPLIRKAGHELWTPSLTGLGERAHLAHPGVNLDHHIQDVLAVIEMEGLRDLVLVGHSYGGMVATGVADRARGRIARLVYLDAFAPDDGESVFDLLPEARRARFLALIAAEGMGWRVPPNPLPPDTTESDRTWASARRRPQPAETFRQPLALTGGPPTLPIEYIYCAAAAPDDVFRRFADKAELRGWRLHELAASHNPHITAPEALAKLLLTFV